MNGYQYNFFDELLVDNFAGGGGASTGIELATGRIVDIAINHDRAAIAMHEKNHPYTKHFCEDVWEIDPRKVTQGRPVALAWFSPDCKHFSKAKGGAPVSKKIRGLAWVAVRWAATVHPRVIIVENVEEFMTWGPIKNGKPIKEKAGRTFYSFVSALKAHGYAVEWRVLKASAFGARTSRKRFFLVARCDGRPIVFPAETHGKARGLKRERSVADCIDFSDLGASVFGRKKPLAQNTLRRISLGLDKFVVRAPKPYIMSNNTGNVPRLVDEPLPTITTGNRNYLCVPTLIQYHGERSQNEVRGQSIDSPLKTIDTSNRYALTSPYLMKYYSGDEQYQSVSTPLHTITTKPRFYLVAPHICTFRNNMIGQTVKEPLSTITAKASHHAVVSAYLSKLTGAEPYLGHWPEIRSMLNDYAGYQISDDEILIIAIDGVQYFISDISMRMLEPRELAKAQGFPDDYILQVSESYSKADQIARIGNSVCPVMAEVLVRANLPELCCRRKLLTMKQLSDVLTA